MVSRVFFGQIQVHILRWYRECSDCERYVKGVCGEFDVWKLYDATERELHYSYNSIYIPLYNIRIVKYVFVGSSGRKNVVRKIEQNDTL